MKRTLLTLLFTTVLVTGVRSQETDADNTDRNRNQSQTAEDQSNDRADINLTAQIRKMVVADDSLSMLAKNVKIITVNGAVTLRGPVENEKEKASIEAHARNTGAKQITNELEIKKS